MNRLPVALLAVALGLPATAMAQSGPSFILIGGGDVSVSGDVHKGAIAPIADLGPLNPALAGVSAELRIGARSYDRIYGKATNFGVEMAWPMASGEVFGQLLSTRTSAGSTEVGGAFVPALDTTLPVYGRFEGYKAMSLEGGYRHFFGTGKVRPYVAGRIGTTKVDGINATFTIPDAAITLTDVPFFDGGWQMSGGADLGLLWSMSEKASLALEVGARYHGEISDDDSALSGLGLASINDAGKRTSYPVNLRLQFRF
ncbi:hypothetical protein [Thermomonas sp. LB-4]|uniref:hypothetical protein n=1 Tax=Thermomonas sp. LB-4 TaxID=3102790 RepID=UPI002ED86025